MIHCIHKGRNDLSTEPRLLRIAQSVGLLRQSSSTRFDNQEFVSPRLIDRPNYFYAKRAFDITLIFLSMFWLSPLLLFAMLLIKLDSPGPIFFVQRRVGARRIIKDGRVEWVVQNFSMFKFRSMVPNADQSLHQEMVKSYVAGKVQPDQVNGAAFKIVDDPRITRIGRILRKTSIDELPQLLNVLRGEMSLVGPRPVPEYETELYKPADFERLTILPGLTGLWQVSGRGDLSFAEMIKLDVEYIRNWTLLLDVKLLFSTIPCVLFGRGAE